MDSRSAVLAALKLYRPNSSLELETLAKFTEFILRREDCLERSCPEGHLTASGWVLSKDLRNVLLIHHRKLDRWLQPGGHCDGNPEPLMSALREVQEETAIVALPFSPTSSEIFDLDIHTIPEHNGVVAHLHFDIRYLLVDSGRNSLQRNKESHAAQWCPLAEVSRLTSEPSILRMRDKALSRVKMDSAAELTSE